MKRANKTGKDRKKLILDKQAVRELERVELEASGGVNAGDEPIATPDLARC